MASTQHVAPSRQQQSALRRVLLRVIEAFASFVFFWAVVHHVYSFDLRPLAALCLPILVAFFAFSSLLFLRGRSLAPGKTQIRSLYAAERAMQASVWYLFGIILGVSCYGLLLHFGVTFDPGNPTPEGLWLLVFIAPYALMQTGFIIFMRAAWLVTPQLFGRISPFEIRRRIEQATRKDDLQPACARQ